METPTKVSEYSISFWNSKGIAAKIWDKYHSYLGMGDIENFEYNYCEARIV